MNNEEKVVAVVEPQSVNGESELATQITKIENKAEAFIVTNEDEYTEAGEFGRILKQKMAEVTNFFAPMKKAAHDAHKQVCDREKNMLQPLKSAEASLKKSMSAYILKKEEERKAKEEEARRIAQAEAEAKLAESIKAEDNGDTEAAEMAMIDAEIADRTSRTFVVPQETTKVEGVSASKDWEIESIDESLVPTSVAGMVIRPVDKSAVMKLIRASKGTIEIKGIKYKEKVKMSFRR